MGYNEIPMTVLLKQGTLWERLKDRTEKALRCRLLQSIPTESEFIEDGGIRFLVRMLSSLERKDEARKKQDREIVTARAEMNPFLPYDEDMLVADISETHVGLLNKFNVVDYHLLIVTRSFEEQESLLTLHDFEAMWACMAEYEGLAFYNGGEIAGASQPHKHLQIVPLPLASSGPKVPIEPVFTSVRFQDAVGTTPGLPFIHAFIRLDPLWMKPPLDAARVMLKCYYNLLRAVGLRGVDMVDGRRQLNPYNLLVTREWMLLVPRLRECFDSISVNSLGFAGALLVRNERQMNVLKKHGPMTLLKSVAVPIKSMSI